MLMVTLTVCIYTFMGQALAYLTASPQTAIIMASGIPDSISEGHLWPWYNLQSTLLTVGARWHAWHSFRSSGFCCPFHMQRQVVLCMQASRLYSMCSTASPGPSQRCLRAGNGSTGVALHDFLAATGPVGLNTQWHTSAACDTDRQCMHSVGLCPQRGS